MGSKLERHAPNVLASKPSSSFSSVSSAGSATSAGSSRSGGSKLLFGEILETNSDRSSESFASVCSFVLCDSSTFLTFWLNDECRNKFISLVPKGDLASLRLACHDFSVRAAPALFSDLNITFRANTFTKPARLAALDRLGFYVKSLQFTFSHTADTFLPPLVDPDTGAELNFIYTPQLQAPDARRPKYGDAGTTGILTRQYPPLFHASTNVSAFIRAMSAFVKLEHLKISCPGYDASRRHRRGVVDFALISLRIAVEQNPLNALDSLTLSPIHPAGLLYLSPTLGYGATPRSSSRWSRIRTLTINAETVAPASGDNQPDHIKLLSTYLHNFRTNLTTFNFRWIGARGPLPVQQSVMSAVTTIPQHPAQRHVQLSRDRRQNPNLLCFPKIQIVNVENVKAAATDISAFVANHKRTLCELNLEDMELTSGDWNEALAPLTRIRRFKSRARDEMADIPIMLSPTTATQVPIPLHCVEEANEADGRRSLRLSSFLGRKPAAARKVREGLLGCEEQLKKALMWPWK